MLFILFAIFYECIEILSIKQWFACWDFRDNFIINFQHAMLNLTGNLSVDKGASVVIVRLFHNKLFVFLQEIFGHYGQYFDVRFLSNVVSLVGLVGFGLGLWYYIRAKKKEFSGTVLLVIVLFLPLFEIFIRSTKFFNVKIVLFWLPLQLFSLFGYFQFFKEKRKISIAVGIALLLLSYWMLIALPRDLVEFCTGIK